MTSAPGRPTTYNGIQMRSRLEADYAAWMDRVGRKWEYEPVCFASSDGQWLPDFRAGKARVLQEVKSAHLLEQEEGEGPVDVINRIDVILQRMTIAWASEPDAWLELIFWAYGACEPTLSIAGRRDDVWQASGNGLPTFPLLWAGMGQVVTLFASLHGDRQGAE